MYLPEDLKALFAAGTPDEKVLYMFFLFTGERDQEVPLLFFNFFIANDWLEKNHAARMKRVKKKRVPTDLFHREEFERIVDATYAYGG